MTTEADKIDKAAQNPANQRPRPSTTETASQSIEKRVKKG